MFICLCIIHARRYSLVCHLLQFPARDGVGLVLSPVHWNVQACLHEWTELSLTCITRHYSLHLIFSNLHFIHTYRVAIKNCFFFSLVQKELLFFFSILACESIYSTCLWVNTKIITFSRKTSEIVNGADFLASMFPFLRFDTREQFLKNRNIFYRYDFLTLLGVYNHIWIEI